MAHPENADKITQHQTMVKVQKECTAKAEVKAAHEKARQQSIICAAEFEHMDMVNEDQVNATPHPSFTPIPWPPPHNQTDPSSSPLPEMSKAKMSDNLDRRSFVPPNSEVLTTINDSADETGEEIPPVKKQKTVAKGKNKAKNVVANKAGKKKQVVKSDIETVASATEPPQKSKPNKPRMWDEVDLAARKIVENKKPGSKYGNMVKSMLGKQEEAKSSGKPAPKVLSHQVTEGDKRGLEREGAMIDMQLFGQEQEIMEISEQLLKQNSIDDPPDKM
jgi:hypothetical protein